MEKASSPRVPTLKSVDHFGFTVPDLDEAVSFFVEHFGGELIYKDGPFSDPDSDSMHRRLNVDPAAACRLATVRVGLSTNLEIFQYEAPQQAKTGPRNSDIGGHHIGFYVDDIDAAYAYVRAIPGVEVQEGPNDVPEDSPIAGQRWFYFRAPWGMQLELTNCSTPGFYKGLPGAGMAPPATSWR